MIEKSDKQIEFLYSAINDAQELIRFIDTKTAIAITIIGSIFLGFFSTLDTIIKYFFCYSIWFQVLFFLLVLFLIICIWLTTRIINPTDNPKDNLLISSKRSFKIYYFLNKNKYSFGFPFINSSKHKLDEKFDEYLTSLSNTKPDDILEILTFELFKVNFIRNIKNDRFNVLVKYICITTSIFLIEHIIYLYQTRVIENIVNQCSLP